MREEENQDNFDDPELDRLLGGYFANGLSSKLGGAEGAFLASRRNNPRRWTIPASLAATIVIAAGVGLKLHSVEKPRQISASSRPPSQIAAADEPQIQSEVYSTTSNVGEFEIEGVPTRAYQHEIVQTTEVYDPKTQITIQTTTPSEQVVYVALKQY
jgi:hypothetical protein